MTKHAPEASELETRQSISLEFGHAFKAFEDLWERIAHRAYQAFEGRGGHDGQDLEDWLAAEADFFSQVPVEIEDRDNHLIIRAKLPGFDKGELSVFVEPHRILIKGQSARKTEHNSENDVHHETSTREIWRSLKLPAEVNESTATAAFKDGVLEVTLEKTVNTSNAAAELNIQ